MKNNISPPTLPAGSLNRASMILTAIAQGSRRGISLTELVAKTALPRPTIHRVLSNLIAIGWVVRDEKNPLYNLGLDLTALGYTAIARNPIEQIASTPLSTLAVKLNQMVYINIRLGLDMVCIGRYESHSDIQIGKGYVSMRGPFGMSPGCMGMFSCMPKNEVEEIVKANMSRYHRIEGFDEKGFHRSLAQSMEKSYGIYGNILLDRTTSGLGVGICNPSAYPVAGIGTTFITEWLDDDQQVACISQLKRAALEISNRLFSLDN